MSAAQTVAILGASSDPERYAFKAQRLLKEHGHRVIPVDAIAISRRAGLGRIVNSALLGAFARAIGMPPLAALERTLAERSPKLTAENLAACGDGYRTVDALLAEEVAA